MTRFHGGHITLSIDWEDRDWWWPRGWLMRSKGGAVVGVFGSALGVGVQVSVYERIEGQAGEKRE